MNITQAQAMFPPAQLARIDAALSAATVVDLTAAVELIEQVPPFDRTAEQVAALVILTDELAARTAQAS